MKVVVFSLLFFLAACGAVQSSEETSASPTTPPDMTGYVMDHKDDQVLVAASSEDTDQPYASLWVSGVSTKGLLGERVEVWIDGEPLDSTPPQAEASDISTIEMSQVEGAERSTDDVVSSALTELENPLETYAIHMISFDASTDQWEVAFATSTDEIETIRIADQK
ncbi:DUF3221 domain-containing protein [Halobacillus locisalis]|uniref:DUF3221 domain-containing protein n=1 Tax=Halobacillus locisalis TaxID=220753 RepID=A0A838CT68_9BACI|nr:DUF3221 domain-containing protein [Halobacillus locisalis]MBA2175019.1 DUF3221 domain-containing protein [Halobacillus locisalis]